MLGVVQGAMCFFLHIYSYSQGVIDDAGNTADIWVMSISLYTSIIIVKKKKEFIFLKNLYDKYFWN